MNKTTLLGLSLILISQKAYSVEQQIPESPFEKNKVIVINQKTQKSQNSIAMTLELILLMI